MSNKILLGMSGGVDSTVSAVLLQEQGYEVVGVYMRLHDNEEYHKENFDRVKIVAKHLNIEVHFHDLSEEFNREVYEYFIDSYKEGLTPNPCVMCNRTIKFGAMVDFADELGISSVATGHYLRTDGRYIYAAVDESKDQSYFLAEIKKEVIPRLVFPLGEWQKSDVKEFASKIEPLQNFATQKESSEICFVPGEYTDILSKHMDIDIEGDVLNVTGDVVGKHKGYMHYTIGKRRGFTVNGAHDPHYVLASNAKTNQITVATREYLAEDEFEVSQINLFDDLESFECEVKVRYRTKSVPAQITIDQGRGSVKLHEPVYGLARGQFAVFYDGDRLLGGGVII